MFTSGDLNCGPKILLISRVCARARLRRDAVSAVGSLRRSCVQGFVADEDPLVGRGTLAFSTHTNTRAHTHAHKVSGGAYNFTFLLRLKRFRFFRRLLFSHSSLRPKLISNWWNTHKHHTTYTPTTETDGFFVATRTVTYGFHVTSQSGSVNGMSEYMFRQLAGLACGSLQRFSQT